MFRTHKDVFSEYLSDAERWTGPTGTPKMEDWREWLERKGLRRCSLTGLYGEHGHEVAFIYDYDEPVRLDGIYPARLMAQHKGYEVVEDTDGGKEVLRLIVANEQAASAATSVGEAHLSFSDGLFASKEERLEKYLEGKPNI